MRALVVVDYQNDFVDGSLGSPEAAAIEDCICSRIDAALESGGDVFFTLDTHSSDYLDSLEGRMLPVPHCIRGTGGWKVHGRVASYLDRGKVLEKDTFGCRALLDELSGYDEIELCGVATNICVMANAVMARTANPDARVIVCRDAVASYDPEAGEKALAVMESLQIEVL